MGSFLENASYRPLAAYYDQLMAHVDYEAWVDYALRRLNLPLRAPRRGGEPPLILDLACGTGTISVALARRGYRVIGVDRSPEMLAVAEEKARRAGVGIFFTCQDLREFELAEPGDAAICLFDSLNYLTGDGDLEKAFRQAAASLAPRALLLFDLHTEYRLREYGETTFADGGEDVAYIWESAYDPERRLCTMYLSLFARQGDGRYVRYDEVHEERAFTRDEVLDALAATGWTLVGEFGELSDERPRSDEGRIFYLARRD
jgi:SAM-dependent methyltransferases related to tRNA (uracil-5-)-methyltransferase